MITDVPRNSIARAYGVVVYDNEWATRGGCYSIAREAQPTFKFIQYISCGLLELGTTSRAALRTHQCVFLWRYRCYCCNNVMSIENNGIGNNAATPLVAKFELLMNSNEWIAHVQWKNKQKKTRKKNNSVMAPLLNPSFLWICLETFENIIW